MNNPKIKHGKVSKLLLVINIIMCFVYFSWWLLPNHIGIPVLYSLLVGGEIYHIFMSLSYIHTVWPRENHTENVIKMAIPKWPTVDIFIPVAGEPAEVIRKTAKAALDMDYPYHKIHILNDGFVAGKKNWLDAVKVAKQLNIECITRMVSGGAKAGNLNFAISKTKGELIAVLDADMVPHKDFLKKTVPYFYDKKVGFVQTPQYYSNNTQNSITSSAWEQQEFFFGPILKGKEGSNAAFICGTNVVIRRKTLLDVKGFYDDSITEDFLTSLFIHQKGWKSYYLAEVLVEGLAPQDLLSYYKQQFRWAKGTLEVIFTNNPVFKRNLSFNQKIQYLTSAFFYLNGLIVFIDLLMPLLFFYFNLPAVVGTTTSFAIFFLPYMILNLYAPYLASKGNLSYRALSFTFSSWIIHLRALISVIFKQKSQFAVTSKQAIRGNFQYLVTPHILYIILGIIGAIIALNRDGFQPQVATNIAWAVFNMIMFLPFIRAAYYYEMAE